MYILKKIKKSIDHLHNTKNNIIKSPENAYNIWAKNYDNEKDNLILHYDNIILKELISKIHLKDKIIFDYGCGTGRNWPLLLDKNPTKVIGCDISQKMLHKLKEKYPNAEVYKSKDLKLSFCLILRVILLFPLSLLLILLIFKKCFQNGKEL